MVNAIDSRVNNMASQIWNKLIANDTNGDGQLNKSELQKFMDTMTSPKNGTNPNLNEMFAKADTNNDGFITKDEFTNMLKNQNPLTKPEGQTTQTPSNGATSSASASTLNKIFTAIDINGDNKISKNEMSAYLLKQLDIMKNNQPKDNIDYTKESSTNDTDNPTSSLLNLLA